MPITAQMLARGPVLVFGFASAIWSIVVLPSFLRLVPATAAAARVIEDDSFRRGAAPNLLAIIEGGRIPILPHPDFARASALVRVRLAKDAIMRRSSAEADSEFAAAEASLRFALIASPGDSFLWLTLYSIKTTRAGFSPADVGYLEESYNRGPLEGWIALRRNKLGLAAFRDLSEPLQDKVVTEFATLVESGFTEHAAINLTGIGWAQRDRLLTGLTEVYVVSREALAKRLARDGVQVTIPGVSLDERLLQR
ncbi:hypothetical protein [Bradyrhizobium sp. USDA 4354]